MPDFHVPQVVVHRISSNYNGRIRSQEHDRSGDWLYGALHSALESPPLLLTESDEVCLGDCSSQFTIHNEPKKGESAIMKCPKCGTETLNEFSVRGEVVERCSACNGTWFDARELSQLLAEEARYVASLRRGSIKEQLAGKKGFCPRDASELLRVYSSMDRGVILDACAECRGIWLDGGEFDKLFAARQT